MVGETISHYRILEKLGEGGMGVVYKAEDTKLGRAVALKFLRSEAVESDELKARFLHEAQAAAALDHPNICTVHEIDEADGQTFLAMAYVEGESLAEKVKKRPLPLDEALDIAVHAAEGVHAAHEKGIVHRDVKSANIMVTGKGQVKIMDFGLAHLAGGTKITKTGTTLGTPAYMSPEQVRGETTDHRTDIWSLGVALYEMVTGRLPFEGETEPAVSYAILHEESEPVTALRTGIPVSLDRIVSKALAKEAEERYQHVADLLVDLRAAKRMTGAEAAGGKPSIAVMPFLNMRRDEETEYLSDGMTEDIINALMRVKGLRVAARSEVFQFKGRQLAARQAGSKLGVGAVLEGSVRTAGQRLRITAELIDARSGYHIWSERFDRVLEDIFDIQDEISRAIVEKLAVKLAGEPKGQLVKRYTDNLEAYNLYLKGLFHWYRQPGESLSKAIQYFEQALATDPEYTLAYSGLADCYSLLAFYQLSPPWEAIPKAAEAAEKAVALDDTLAEAHASLGFVAAHRYDWPNAEKEFQRAIELKPSLARVHFWYGLFSLATFGRLDEAVEEMTRAQELDPVNPLIAANFGCMFLLRKEYERALEQAEKTLELAPDHPVTHWVIGRSYLAMGRFEDALRAFNQARLLNLGDIAVTYAKWGKLAEAEKILEELKESVHARSFGSYLLAPGYAALGDLDRAFECLEAAYEERSPLLFFLGSDPLWDPVRSHPRFKALVRQIGLER